MKNRMDQVEGRNLTINIRYIKTVMFIFVLLFTMFNKFDLVGATTVATLTTVNVAVDYQEEIVRVTTGTGNSTKFYMSTDKKTWETIETTGVVDISTILTKKATIIYFKGNKDITTCEVPLAGEDSTLKATYKNEAGEGKIEFNTPLAVEYRKGVNGVWKTAYNLMPTSIYEIKGATLYFRTPATTIKRAGKTISLKIAKRPSAPSVKVDGSKLNISGLKLAETQYRVGDSLTWITFTSLDSKAKTIDLYTLLSGGIVSNAPIPAGVIEFRTPGSLKKITSAIKVVEIPLQLTVPDVISISGTSLTIKDIDLKRAYEYTKVEKNAVLNMNTAKWTSVTSKNTVKLSKIAVGDKILVRLKSITDPKTKQIIPASTYKEFVISTIS